MKIVGVDPGRSGGFAIIDDQSAVSYFWNDEKFIEQMR